MELTPELETKPWHWTVDSRMLELFGRGAGLLLCYMASRYKYFKECGKLYKDNSFYLNQKTIAKEIKCSLNTVQRDSKRAEAKGVLLVAPAHGEVNYYGINVQAWPQECRHPPALRVRSCLLTFLFP
jgi:hypothetical protein